MRCFLRKNQKNGYKVGRKCPFNYRGPIYEKAEVYELKRYIAERDVEKTLIRQVGKGGGLCLKFISPGWSGAPDRLCLWPGGRVMFAELKRPGGKMRPLQERRKKQLEELGFEVALIDSKGAAVEMAAAKAGGGAGAKT